MDFRGLPLQTTVFVGCMHFCTHILRRLTVVLNLCEGGIVNFRLSWS